MNSGGRGQGIFPLVLSDPESARRRPELAWASGTCDHPTPFFIQHPLSRVSVQTGKRANGPSAVHARNVAWGGGGVCGVGTEYYKKVEEKDNGTFSSPHRQMGGFIWTGELGFPRFPASAPSHCYWRGRRVPVAGGRRGLAL